MAVWLRLLVVLALAVIESISSQHTQESIPQYMSVGYIKKSNKILDKLLNEDYHETAQELGRINREYRDFPDGFDRKNSKMLEDEISQEFHHQINSLSPLISKRRVRSQKNRREKLNKQSMRNHRAHSLESDRRRRLQPNNNVPHMQSEEYS